MAKRARKQMSKHYFHCDSSGKIGKKENSRKKENKGRDRKQISVYVVTELTNKVPNSITLRSR